MSHEYSAHRTKVLEQVQREMPNFRKIMAAESLAGNLGLSLQRKISASVLAGGRAGSLAQNFP